jgi:hypothetical protein
MNMINELFKLKPGAGAGETMRVKDDKMEGGRRSR